MTSIAKTLCWEPGADEFPVWVRKTATEFAVTVINIQDLTRRRPLLRYYNICARGFFQSHSLSLSGPLFSLSLVATPYVQIYILDKNQYLKEIKTQPDFLWGLWTYMAPPQGWICRFSDHDSSGITPTTPPHSSPKLVQELYGVRVVQWPKSSFGFFHSILWKNSTELLANPISLS